MGGEKRCVYGVIESEPVEVLVYGVGVPNTVDAVSYRDHAVAVQDIDTTHTEQIAETVSAHDGVTGPYTGPWTPYTVADSTIGGEQ